MGEKKKESRWQAIRRNLIDFRYFMLNVEEGTVLGRDANSWGNCSLLLEKK